MEKTSNQTEQWLRMLIDSAEDYAIFAVTPEGKVCTWSRGAKKLFGYSEQEILGQDFALIFTPEDHAFEDRWWSPVNSPILGKNGEVTHIIHRVEDVGDFVRQLQVEGNSIRDLNTSERRLCDMAQEIVLRGQELKLANEDLRRSREALAHANTDLELRVQERTKRLTEKVQELEAFSYSLSHDMRAPLRAMQSFAQILCRNFKERVGPDGAELLNRIENSAARLDQLIEDVLTLSRLSRERIESKPVDLEKLLRHVIQERPALQAPHAEIQIASPLLPVLGHEASLSQCFSNLLDNAVKFVAPGTLPRVQIRSEPRDHMVRVWVEDNGIGLRKEDFERIFGMFQRLHGTAGYPGTGIGLTIVRKAVERMRGKVGVESEPGQGSRFWIELPKGDR